MKREKISPLSRAGLALIMIVAAALLSLTLKPGAQAAGTTMTAGKLQYAADGGNAAIMSCEADATDADLAAAIEEIAGAGYVVTRIENQAFRNCANLTGFATLTSLDEIGNEAFSGCTSLTEIRLPEGLKTIGSYAFRGCAGLTEISLPEGLKTIHISAFSGTNISEIIIPKTVTSMGEALVGAKQLRTVIFADGIQGIPSDALQNTNQVTTVVIPTSIKTIGSYAFDGCSPLTFIIDENYTNLTEIGSYAFRGCAGLTEISLPEGLKTIHISTFSGTNISEIIIPKTVTSMQNALVGASQLETVTFVAGMIKIPNNALQGANQVTTVNVPQSVQSVGTNAFAGMADDFVIYGYYGSAIIEYAEQNGIPHVTWVLSLEQSYEQPVQYIPYQHIFGLLPGVNREDVEFFTSPADAARFAAMGWELLPNGEIYGVPKFVEDFSFTLYAYYPKDDPPPVPEQLEVTLKVNDSTDANILAVNDYLVQVQIGSWEPGGYVLTGDYASLREVVFKVSGEYGWFADLWLNGVKLNWSLGDYRAEDGSTMVTLMERTLQGLDNNSKYTVAAEFKVYDAETGTMEVQAVAQNFTTRLTGNRSPSGQPGQSGTQPGQSGTQPGQSGETPAQPSQEATQPTQEAAQPSQEAAQPTQEAAQPTQPAAEPTQPAAQPTQPPAEPTQSAAQPTQPPAEPTQSAAQPTQPAAQPTQSATQPTQPATQPTQPPTQPTQSQDQSAGQPPTQPSNISSNQSSDPPPSQPGTSAAVQTPGLPGFSGSEGDAAYDVYALGSGESGNQAPPNQAALDPTTSLAPPANPAVNPAPGQTVLAEAAPDLNLPDGDEADGTPDPAAVSLPGEAPKAEMAAAGYSLNYDGTGPLEVRVDIPLEEFRELYMDGELWIRETDYTARSGSTILTVSQARMERLEAGGHRLSAVFASQTVDFELTLSGRPVLDAGSVKTGSVIPMAAGAGAVLAAALVMIRQAAAKRRRLRRIL